MIQTGIAETHKTEMFQVGEFLQKNTLREPPDPFITINLRLDNRVLVNLCETKGLSDWLSQVGGLSKSLVLVFLIISREFSQRIFFGTVLENLFFIKKSRKED